MSSYPPTTGTVVYLRTAHLPRSGVPKPMPYCFGVVRTLHEAWAEATAAHSLAREVPNDERTQDSLKRVVSAMSMLSSQVLQRFSESDINATAFMAITIARETIYLGHSANNMSWWLR